MIPFSVEIIGRNEPIDAVKVAYGVNKQTGKRYCYILTPDMRIASFDVDCPSHILWENTPNKEAIDFVNRLYSQMMHLSEQPIPIETIGVECQ